MTHEHRSLLQNKPTRLLWLLGIIFALIVTYQYFKQPYGGGLSSLLSNNEIPARNHVSGFEASSSKPHYGNITSSSDTDPSDQAPSPARGPYDFEGGNSTVGNLKDHHDSGTFGSLPEDVKANDQNLSNGKDDLVTVIEEGLTKENITSVTENNGKSNSGFVTPIPAMAPEAKDVYFKTTEPALSPRAENLSQSTPEVEDPFPEVGKEEELESLQPNITSLESRTSRNKINPLEQYPGAVPISEMRHLLQRSRASYGRSVKPKWSSPADKELSYARKEIEKAAYEENDSGLYTPLYNNVSRFKRSYDLMEKMLKVYIYKEGAKPVFHKPVLKGIYASEGWFMKQLESSKAFLTKNPNKAHLFYLPFSTRMLEVTLYVPDSHSNKNLVQYLKNYLDLLTARYTFWNRTEGADHFLVACHDWAPSETMEYMGNCIRSMCNSDVKEGFVFGKDASLPETYIPTPKKPLRGLGGKAPSQRPFLAFFAGRMHGYVRPILLRHWGGNRDPNMKIFGEMPHSKKKSGYIEHMKSSKYCICAKGYEVNSPRVVEAIFYECVPVIISDNFVPPFFEILNWESFAVFVLEKDIPNLKNILLSIPDKTYREMQKRVRKVQQHFLWHPKPVKYDVFHMILHSVWYNRVFQI